MTTIQEESVKARGIRRAQAWLAAACCVGWMMMLKSEAAQPFAKSIETEAALGGYAAVQASEADADGSVYVAGAFRLRAAFATGIQLNAGGVRAFVAKQEANGGWAWAATATGLFGDLVDDHFGVVVTDLAVKTDALYLSGYMQRAGDVVDPNMRNGFVVKLTKAGSVVWTRYFLAAQAVVNAVDADSAGNVYAGGGAVAGASSRRLTVRNEANAALATINTVADAFGLANAANDSDAFIVKLSASGGYLWNARAGAARVAPPSYRQAEETAGLKVDAIDQIHAVVNIAGSSTSRAQILHANGGVYASLTTSCVGAACFGSIIATAGKLNTSGTWLAAHQIDGDLGAAPRPAFLVGFSQTVEFPATDLHLADGKVYVAGAYHEITLLPSLSVKPKKGYLVKLSADSYVADGGVAYFSAVTAAGPEAFPRKLAGHNNRIFVTGKMPPTLLINTSAGDNPALGSPEKEVTSVQDNEFVVAFDRNLFVQWAHTTAAANDEVRPSEFNAGTLAYDSSRQILYWGGWYGDTAGRPLLLGEEPPFAALASKNRVQGWLTAFRENGDFLRQARLTVTSVFGPITLNGAGLNAQSVERLMFEGTTVTASVPAEVAQGSGTRQRCTGFRIDGSVVSGDANSHTFQLEADATLRFGWQTEHKLTIGSDHALAGLSETAAAGSAEPPIGISWIKEGELVNAFVDGYVLPADASQVGTRHIVTGYDATGAAGGNRNFPLPAERQQVPQFTMSGPGTIQYRWKQQHRLQVSTTGESSLGLPLARQVDAKGAELKRGAGSGEFWFDHGARLEIGARAQDGASGQALKGWRNADPITAVFPKIQFIAPDDAVADAVQLAEELQSLTISGQAHWAHAVSSFTQAARITWDYGDLIYPVEVAIGNPLSLPGAAGIPAGQPPLAVRVVDSPAGSTGNDMQIWDDVADKAYPLRPGIYFLDWDNGAGGKIVTQVFAGFPGEPVPQSTRKFPGASHYRYIADSPPEATPAVALDPDPEDLLFFMNLKYQTGNAIAADKKYSAASAGKAVLLFSESSDTNQPAAGDLTRETLLVRVVETRMWNSAVDWAGGVGMVKGPVPATIGTKVSSAFDTAGIGTGYLIHRVANYNADLHDRARAVGPIIPVNRSLVSPPAENELVVVWQERVNGILWPYQPVKYGPFNWPAPPDGPNPAKSALQRIVIASRLGSEGLDAAGNEQIIFDPARYGDVKIYNQPDRTAPGYNPNEEHARIYPSFLGNFLGYDAPAAFALRNDLNISEALIQARPGLFLPDEYTSDPHVLAQFFDKEAGEAKMVVYAVQREDAESHDPRLFELGGVVTDTYIFRYTMKAGERVTPPYPLNLIAGLEPCVNTVPGLESIQAAPNGSYFQNGSPLQRAWFVDHKGGAWAVSGGSYLMAHLFYRLAPDFWYPGNFDSHLQPAIVGDCIPLLPSYDLAEHDGVFDETIAVRTRPSAIRFDTVWPEGSPILKMGETLTYPGGENKADHPEAAGLPGIIGWAAGEVIFDAMNPTMSSAGVASHFNQFTARIISPLDERQVPLAASLLPEALRAGSPEVRVEGDTWFFTKLPPSLQKRVFFKPLAKRNANDAPGVLGLRGFVNDRTLGAADLTAAPPPVYVLEPNILTSAERVTLEAIGGGDPDWAAAVGELFLLSRNPNGMDADRNGAPDAGWNVGLEPELVFDANGQNPTPDAGRAAPLRSLGPGLALTTNPMLLDPNSNASSGYVTLAENNHPSLGAAPVAVHVIKVDASRLYRGAIKTILPPNVFDEKITLRHTADFGGNTDQLAFAWWHREEDGTVEPGDVPPGGSGRPVWNALAGADGTGGLNQIDLQNNPSLLLADNLVYARYRYVGDLPAQAASWSDWAGAANSTPRDLNGDGRPDFRAQLAMGWVKRVLDAINPYEARVREFMRAESPATGSSMLQQLGAPYVGPVALNADKDVVENVGLIELYETVLQRARSLSIDASQPAFTPGITAAILLASTRLADFYDILGNEAWNDSLDATIGFGSGAVDHGSLNASRFCFENQLPSLLEEELALLRGQDDSFGRPVFNRLFWNFTKAEGEVAYALNYQITDANNDGFLDENDALKLYPQGHGDAWGHYLSAMRKRYDLLRHPFFNWDARSEYYNLLDVALPADFSDERKFAQTAAARAQAGAEIVALTYRSRYVENPEGQWQGYVDANTSRAWGVTEWARRAGQAALFDWVTANALLAPEDAANTGLRKIDRKAVSEIAQISANFGAIQTTLDASNNGLNPLGLDPDVVPFDLDPTFLDVGSTAQIGSAPAQGLTHFEQIYERAKEALKNANEAFNFANAQKARLRQVAQSADQTRLEGVARDLEFRNRLIEIFGAPYEGTIGPGKPYPAGYSGADLNLFMYVDVNAIDPSTVPAPAAAYYDSFVGFHQFTNTIGADFQGVLAEYFLKHDGVEDISHAINTSVELLGDDILQLRLPASAADYTFMAPPDWGQRAAPGRLQTLVTEMMQVESDLALAVGDYDYLHKQIRDRIELLKARTGIAEEVIEVQDKQYDTVVGLTATIDALRVASSIAEFSATVTKDIAEATADGLPKVVGTANDAFFGGRLALTTFGATAQFLLRLGAVATAQTADITESSLDILALRDDIAISRKEFEGEIAGMLHEIEELLVNEGVSRIKVFGIREQLRGLLEQYRAKLQEGMRLLEERRNFNARLAAATQSNRYHDLTFRFARHESLQKYRAAFDLAARYCYMAAKAYDFETNFDHHDRGSAIPLLNQITRERSLGEVSGNQPLNRGGLAGIMARLRDNFGMVEGRLGFNNLQLDTTEFSLKSEHFRSATDEDWTAKLQQARVSDLWAVPEFRRFCRPFAPRDGVQPGLVIRFGTQVRAGKNFFGKLLGPGDSAYDPTLYATKIRAAGLRFEGYPATQLARTPYVYLVPAGFDVMTIPDSPALQTRTWNIVDQAIPVPHSTSLVDLGRPDWIPALDSLSGPLGAIRRFSSFRAAVGGAEPSLNVTRFVGRSVWNTDWLLIIPGQTLHADPAAGLNQLIANVSDIKLAFETYGYSGN